MASRGRGWSLRKCASRAGERPPTWAGLGSAISRYLGDGFGADGPIDALSSFEQFHGRPALVDKLRDLLLVDEIEPSEVHAAFAKIPFETVLTTNIDFLLEKAWSGEPWPFDPIIGEHRLTARMRRERTQLVKLHGDVHHPDELVVTEEDYEGSLTRFPILATYVASLLTTRVPVLIGYSLDDPDFRSILRVLSDRLGRNGPSPWVILAKATKAQVARYERRGVRVVVLERRSNADHGQVLKALFEQLWMEYSKAAIATVESSRDQVLSELRLDREEGRTLVLFLASNKQLAQHRSEVFDALRLQGLTPVESRIVV